MVTYRPRRVCSQCEGRGLITFTDPTPGHWFKRMGLTYKPGVKFVLVSGDRYDAISYEGHVTDSGLSDGEELLEHYNEWLERDTLPEAPCSACMGVGTVPAPLAQEERIYDRGELMAEAFMDGGYQGWADMADEWSEYVSCTGSHADPLQKQIEQNWRSYQLSSYGSQEDSY